MLKIVPDPPFNTTPTNQSPEDLLVQTAEYLACALTVAQQTTPLHSCLTGQRLTRFAAHEIHRARPPIELALSKVHSLH